MRRFVRNSIAWVAALALVPLTVLLVMQYSFLRRLEETTAQAERNWLRNTVADVVRDVDHDFRSATESALDLTTASLDDHLNLGAHFRNARVPGAKTYFTVRFGEEMWDLSTYDPAGRAKTVSLAEGQAMKVAVASWSVVHHFGTVIPARGLSMDDADRSNRIIVKPITDGALHVAGVAGVVLDNEQARAAMSAIGTASIKKHRHNDLFIRIGDPKQFEPRATGRREFITEPLKFAYMDWLLGVRDVCATPEELAHLNFRFNAFWTGGVAIALIGAIFLGIQATARQMRLSQMKSDFVSNVSHELRTPLSSIRVFGEYMRLGRVEKPEKIREYGEYIETESRRLTQLINNILDFSRIESAEKKYRFAECDAGAIVTDTLSAFEVPLRERGFIITVDIEPSLPPVRADHDSIAQALVNLIDNAVKYSGDRKEISVRVGRVLQPAGPDELRIAVQDHGIGIALGEQKKIFDKFYRVGSGLVHDVKGSGLGLAIVSHIVKAHRGRVEVASTPGNGTTFTIVIPCAATEVRAPVAPPLDEKLENA